MGAARQRDRRFLAIPLTANPSHAAGQTGAEPHPAE